MNGWKNVTRREPCAICGHADWCSRSLGSDTLICRRQGGVGAVERRDRSGGTFWLHSNDPATPRHRPMPIPPASQPDRAGPYELDAVYRALLRRLPLEPRHRQNLRARGLDDGDILRLGYRSLAATGIPRIIKDLIDELGEDLIAKTPGFYLINGRYGPFWAINSGPGILIPCRSIDCEITGIKTRLGNPSGGKYIALSSSKHGGPKALSACHVPVFTGSRKVVRLTEGELKADIATALSDTLTLGLPGCSQWKLAMPALERLKPEQVLLAWDSDWRTNPVVAKSLGDCAWNFRNAGFNVRMEDWDPHVAKGIDDLLASGLEPETKNWMAALAAERRGTAHRAKRNI